MSKKKIVVQKLETVPVAVCPGTLAEGFTTYSATCLKNTFHSKKVSHILPYDPPQKNEKVQEEFIENRKRISISGVQEKLSLLLEKNVLRLTKEGEQGTYILKPIPRDIKNVSQVPANEHLTMQMARQVYRINTAENAMIFFQDGSPAYITKRFDINREGGNFGKEDFATLASLTKDNAGDNFKYEYSYEELGLLIQKYVSAWKIEMEKYFKLVVFNYIFSNGDAHLKNFSLLETKSGDYLLSPAYDLVNTRIHVSDANFGLHKGLFADKADRSQVWKKKGHPISQDFIDFGVKVGIPAERARILLEPFIKLQPAVESLVARSFLNDETKTAYLLHYRTRRNTLLV